MKRLLLLITLLFSTELLAAPTCDEVLDSCGKAVDQLEVTVKECNEVSIKKDELIDSVKEENIAKEKSLSNQKIATTTGFSLSGILLLIILL